MNSLPKILEYIWLILAAVCLVMAIHATMKIGFSNSYMYFILTGVALLMYLLRRFRRKSNESKNIS
jgi:flagellar biogenesis protein FliO